MLIAGYLIYCLTFFSGANTLWFSRAGICQNSGKL